MRQGGKWQLCYYFLKIQFYSGVVGIQWAVCIQSEQELTPVKPSPPSRWWINNLPSPKPSLYSLGIPPSFLRNLHHWPAFCHHGSVFTFPRVLHKQTHTECIAWRALLLTIMTLGCIHVVWCIRVWSFYCQLVFHAVHIQYAFPFTQWSTFRCFQLGPIKVRRLRVFGCKSLHSEHMLSFLLCEFLEAD